jgi:hypothetical protein
VSAARVLSFVADEALPAPKPEMTHEAFVHAVRAAVVPRVVDAAIRQRLLGAKLVYGGGQAGTRGLCYFGTWKNGNEHDFLEIAAISEESVIQLAGTTVHELAHCLAGRGAGHGAEWKAAAKVLGLRLVHAAGQAYEPDHFEPSVWSAIEALPHPTDGAPQFRTTVTGAALPLRPRPCPLGIGTRGGTSRGKGSGSRMRLYVCGCPEGTPGRKARTASDTWDVTCNRCGCRFERA